MTNASSFEGMLSCVLIFIISCVHLRRIRALKPLVLSTKQFGPLSIIYKASVFGVRLKVRALIELIHSSYIVSIYAMLVGNHWCSWNLSCCSYSFQLMRSEIISFIILQVVSCVSTIHTLLWRFSFVRGFEAPIHSVRSH